MGYADDTTIHAVIPRLLSHSQVIESLNQNFGNHLLVLEVAHELNPKKIKSMVANRSRTIAPSYGDLTVVVLTLRR